MLKRESKSIGDILSEYFEENPFLKTKIAEQRAVRAWSELVLRAELQMNKDSLIEKLNEAAGMPIVYDIVLR